MKTIKTLRLGPLVAAVVAAVVLTEVIAARICAAYSLRFDSVAVAALTVALVVGVVAWRYDGSD